MTTRRPLTLLGTAAVPLVALGVAAASGGASAAVTPSKAAARHAVTTVREATNSKLGKILVDSRGRTLYLFTKDTRTKSNCTGACATAWPPLRANGKLRAGSGVKASKLGTIKRSGGKRQVTYNGHPLYGFVMDKKSGVATGEGVTAFGGRFFAVSPAGKQVAPKKSGGGSTSPGNGIPQNNGGDHDSDNNGGPSDGDGNQ